MSPAHNPFEEPTRQSIFAIAVIVYKHVRILFRQLIPLIAIAYFGGSTGRDVLFYVIIGGSLFYMVWSIISYFKFYFFLKNNELNITKGVLKKTNLNIPFERIQTINFRQNLIHRIFNVVQLEIDTAGSKGNEFAFDALSLDKAERLRSILLQGKKSKSKTAIDETSDIRQDIPKKKSSILRLSPVDLLKIGVSENHLKSLGLIFVALFWMMEYVEDMGYESEDVIYDAFDKSLQMGLVVMLVLFAAFLVIGFFISLIRTVVTQYDLNLWREGRQYKLISGLFTKRERTILHRKLQIMEWSDNPLKRIFGIFDVQLKQASSVEVAAQKSIRIPGCYDHHIDFVKQDWLGKYLKEPLVKNDVSIHYLYRRLLYRMLLALAILVIAILIKNTLYIILAVALFPYLIWTSILSYRKAGFAVNQDLVYISKGMFGDSRVIMPSYKIQSIQINQTPFQKRKDLANLVLFTASGKVKIPYIDLAQAKTLQDYLLYKVENSRKKWM